MRRRRNRRNRRSSKSKLRRIIREEISKSQLNERRRNPFPIQEGSEWSDSRGPSLTVTYITIDEDGVTQVGFQEHGGRRLSVEGRDFYARVKSGELTPLR